MTDIKCEIVQHMIVNVRVLDPKALKALLEALKACRGQLWNHIAAGRVIVDSLAALGQL